eukprot:2973029-Amphidinium_carterae.1
MTCEEGALTMTECGNKYQDTYEGVVNLCSTHLQNRKTNTRGPKSPCYNTLHASMCAGRAKQCKTKRCSCFAAVDTFPTSDSSSARTRGRWLIPYPQGPGGGEAEAELALVTFQDEGCNPTTKIAVGVS